MKCMPTKLVKAHIASFVEYITSSTSAVGQYQSCFCCRLQAASSVYSVMFYSIILLLLGNSGQSGKMVARLPLFWTHSFRKRLFPGACCYQLETAASMDT